MSDSLIFLIERGKALKLIKEYLVGVDRARMESIKLVKELDPAAQFRVSNDSGVVTHILFSGKRNRDFTAPGKYGSYPKKGTEWAAKFATQVGHESGSRIIAEAFDIPLDLSYHNDKGHGSTMIGYPFQECGFLHLGDKGPFAMWIPDVEAAVAASEAKGFTVDEPAKSFKPVFAGCKRLHQAEWDLIVATRKVAKLKRALAA